MPHQTKKTKNRCNIKLSEEMKDTFFDLSPDLICIAGMDGHCKYVNPACIKLFGYTEKELLSKPFQEFIHPDDHTKNEEHVACLFKGEITKNFEIRIVCKDSTIKHIQWTATPDIKEKTIYCIGRDITKHKLAKEALIKQQNVVNNYLNIVASMILALNRNGEITLLNKKGHDILGYKEGELYGKDWFSVCLPEENRHELKEYFKKLIHGKAEGQETHENEIVRKDGQKRIVKWYNTLVTDDFGNITGLLSSGEDITEHKQAEKTLEESEEKYRTLINTANEAIIVAQEGVLKFVNKKMSELLDAPAEELLGKPFIDYIWPEDREFVLSNYQRRIAGEKFTDSYDFRIMSAEGNVKWVFITAAKIQWEGKPATINLLTDTTERKLAQEALQESERQFRRAITDSPVPIMIYDEDGNVLQISKGWTDYSGYTIEDIPTISAWTKQAYGSASGTKKNYIDKLFEIDKTVNNCEWNVRAKNGSKRIWEFKTTPIGKNAKGKRILHSMAVDITERKKAEEDIIEQSKELQSVLDSMLNAFVIFDSVFDKNGKFVSYRFVYINEVFEKITGVKDDKVKGKTVHQVWPGTEQSWIEKYGHVAVTGETLIFDNYHGPTQKLYHCRAYRPWDTKDRFCVIFDDITEQKKAEEELIKAKERAENNEKELKKAQALAHIGSWYLDVATNQVTWSEELYRMYGFDPALPVPPYTEHMKLFTPESWDILSSALEKTRKTGIPYELELVTIKKDGSKGWMWVRGEAIQNAEGKTTALWGAAQDITEKKQAEVKLKASERLFRLLAENAKDMIYRMSIPDAIYEYVSPASLDITGYSPNEFYKDADGTIVGIAGVTRDITDP